MRILCRNTLVSVLLERMALRALLPLISTLGLLFLSLPFERMGESDVREEVLAPLSRAPGLPHRR